MRCSLILIKLFKSCLKNKFPNCLNDTMKTYYFIHYFYVILFFEEFEFGYHLSANPIIAEMNIHSHLFERIVKEFISISLPYFSQTKSRKRNLQNSKKADNHRLSDSRSIRFIICLSASLNFI